MNNTKKAVYNQLKSNPTLWSQLTGVGAPKPNDSDCWANDWVANNGSPQTAGFAVFNGVAAMTEMIKGATTGARPVDCE